VIPRYPSFYCLVKVTLEPQFSVTPFGAFVTIHQVREYCGHTPGGYTPEEFIVGQVRVQYAHSSSISPTGEQKLSPVGNQTAASARCPGYRRTHPCRSAQAVKKTGINVETRPARSMAFSVAVQLYATAGLRRGVVRLRRTCSSATSVLTGWRHRGAQRIAA
jgi:hypothetical protein